VPLLPLGRRPERRRSRDRQRPPRGRWDAHRERLLARGTPEVLERAAIPPIAMATACATSSAPDPSPRWSRTSRCSSFRWSRP
jgi:hypothetical protein